MPFENKHDKRGSFAPFPDKGVFRNQHGPQVPDGLHNELAVLNVEKGTLEELGVDLLEKLALHSDGHLLDDVGLPLEPSVGDLAGGVLYCLLQLCLKRGVEAVIEDYLVQFIGLLEEEGRWGGLWGEQLVGEGDQEGVEGNPEEHPDDGEAPLDRVGREDVAVADCRHGHHAVVDRSEVDLPLGEAVLAELGDPVGVRGAHLAQEDEDASSCVDHCEDDEPNPDYFQDFLVDSHFEGLIGLFIYLPQFVPNQLQILQAQKPGQKCQLGYFEVSE